MITHTYVIHKSTGSRCNLAFFKHSLHSLTDSKCLQKLLCILQWIHIFYVYRNYVYTITTSIMYSTMNTYLFLTNRLLFFLLPENYSTFLKILHTYLFHNHDRITMNHLPIYYHYLSNHFSALYSSHKYYYHYYEYIQLLHSFSSKKNK